MSREDKTVFVFNKTKETFLAYRARVADSSLSRLVGLLGKRSLEPDSGLWILPSCGIHTLGMLFTIDVVFLNRNLKVVDLSELVRPFSFTKISWQAESVLELPAHTIFRSQTEVGDQLLISSDEAALLPDADVPEKLLKVEPLQKIGTAR